MKKNQQVVQHSSTGIAVLRNQNKKIHKLRRFLEKS